MTQHVHRVDFILETSISPTDYDLEISSGESRSLPIFIGLDRTLPYEGRVYYQNDRLSFFSTIFLSSQLDDVFLNALRDGEYFSLITPKSKSFANSLRLERGSLSDKFAYRTRSLFSGTMFCTCGAYHTSNPWNHALDYCWPY